MTSSLNRKWRDELGIRNGRLHAFFGSIADLDAADAHLLHAHTIRRAFALLDLDGVLCDQAAPVAYFKLVSRIRYRYLLDLHRKFWNHGGAPLLVVISPEEVHIYSSLCRPKGQVDTEDLSSGLVTTLSRASTALREFLPSVESGEFFRRYPTSFNARERVDNALLDNLRATREKLRAISNKRTDLGVLDAFLCRLVFTCYLFDRGVIGEGYLADLGLPDFCHLRDILGLKPRSEAKAWLYRLFRRLAKDFNGDLFNDDLDAEASLITSAHIQEVDSFFHGTDVRSGQHRFWPYDFEAIPIEAVSAIYEHFLKPSDKEAGSFYTPRLLAELVLDIALAERQSLINVRFLDPACGSGIFLVSLFNRIAEEWKRSNPGARNDRRARELAHLLQFNIAGIDVNPIACRISAFSLYLAYLDQLSPRDIQELQKRGRALPKLVTKLSRSNAENHDAAAGIWCGDFFEDSASRLASFDLVVGNPPWGSNVAPDSTAGKWLARNEYQVPDCQIAAAFMLKAPHHIRQTGRVCFVLPHGILFNHSQSAISFQKYFISKHSLDSVLNLTDFQSFLFSEARHPALVLNYRNKEPSESQVTKYWAPKADWKALKAGIITVANQDRSALPLKSILQDLNSRDAPQIWKRMAWATGRDRRFLDRLSEYPRLGARVRQARDKDTSKPWLIAEGFQPLGKNDDRDLAANIQLPSNLFIEASSPRLRLFLLEDDCVRLPSKQVIVRSRSNKRVEIFDAPHVLVAQGFEGIAFADFPVSFRHALRGINGPGADRQLLMFLAAYMGSPLAKYYQFHTSSNWGVSRSKVHVEELLRLPFPQPSDAPDPVRARAIVEEAASIMDAAIRETQSIFTDRADIVEQSQKRLEPLIYEYFDVIDSERVLIEDTVQITINSFRPSANNPSVPAIEPSSYDTRRAYVDQLCATLNSWIGETANIVGSTTASPQMGIGLVILEKGERELRQIYPDEPGGLLSVLDQFRNILSKRTRTFEFPHSIRVFDGPRLYLMKTLDRRYWTRTAALNDADDVASSILMHSSESHS